MKNRRDFIKLLSIGGAATMLPLNLSANSFANKKKKSLKFGLCADVHKDIMHDADSRLQAFIEEASEKEL
ncbi:MAG: twin-arginine translocation signal domain-containing protein, partial [Bacteroidota bacterium]|nr:twin-arginine translocation signal domain-containing protein [Bacteroidota bacterium]